MSDESPRVLFLVSEDWYFCSHRLGLARALKNSGCDVAVACRVADHGDAITGAGLTLYPIDLARGSVNPLRLIAAVTRIARLYRRVRPDIVHHVALVPALLGSLAARLAGVPRTVNAIAGLGSIFSSTGGRAAVVRPFARCAMRCLLDRPTARTIVQNEDDGEVLSGGGMVAAARLRLIPGAGVDLDRFTPRPEPAGPPRATMVSRMIAEKGVADLVAAARLLAGDGSPLRVRLAGGPDPGNPGSIAPAQLAAWADEGVVEILGHLTDIPALWAESHVAVLPSHYGEGVPLALIEAAACGRPMIAADGPGLRDIVRDGETGLLVPPHDPRALAAALARLAGDGVLRRKMGAAARRLAETRFAAPAVVEATLEVYRELLGAAWPRHPTPHDDVTGKD